MDFILRYQWLRIAYLCTFLVIANSFIIYFFDISVSRIARWISVLIFILFFMHHRGLSKKIVFLTLLLFLLRDGFIIQYEVVNFKTLSFIITNIAYVFLIFLNLRKTNFLCYNPVLIVFTLVMIALNGFNLFYLSDVIFQGLDNNFQFGLFFLQGVFLIFLGLIAFTYNDRFEGRTPLLFLYFSFSLILCDLAGLAAYFFKWEIAYYPERIFYIVSIALLINFSLNEKAEERKSLLFVE